MSEGAKMNERVAARYIIAFAPTGSFLQTKKIPMRQVMKY